MASYDREILNRLGRIEELGINIDKDADWLTVDDASRTVYISTLGRSLTVMLSDMVRLGAEKFGQAYDVVHKGNVVGSVVLQRVN